MTLSELLFYNMMDYMSKNKFKPLYSQLIFTFLAFALMVILSYMFDSGTVKKNLSRNAENVLSFTHQKIESELIAAKIMLGTFSQTVQRIIHNDNFNYIQSYINIISDYTISGESDLKNINGVYGYFVNHYGEGAFLYSDKIDWIMPEDFSPTEFSWYKNAVENYGTIVETQPYYDYMSDKYIITYSLCIKSIDDNYLSVVCIDVPLDKIGNIVISAALSEGGYGVLAAADLTIFAHANSDFIGMRLDDPRTPISQFKDYFYQGKVLYERPMKNWKEEDVIVFSRTMQNGWHLVLLSPKSNYYTGTTRMLFVLCVLGAILAAALAVVFFRIDKAREKAGEESRQKSVFLANMSHEIRTPMNAIIGMTYIGKTSGDIPRKDYCFDKIENASAHLLGVINDILDMSKIEANMFELSLEDFNFEKTLQRVINIISFRAEEKKQKVSVHIDNSIPRVLLGDEQRLAQVITNLLSNAVKFTPEEGSITLDAELVSKADGECIVKITVKDTGIGISPDQQEDIFRAFKQADAKISRKFGGTGLGLSISKNIAELMSGKIELESELGKGSSFSFTFKAGCGQVNELNGAAEPKEEEKIDYNGIFKGKKILLAEDVEINKEIIQTLIEPTLLEMDWAKNGAEAVTLFGNSPYKYDLILMDVQMPEMDGYEASRKIRLLEKTMESSSVPIVAMTANVFKEDVEKCLKSGMNNHISKPINVSEFFGILKKYFL